MKRLLTFCLVLAVVAAFSLPVLAQEVFTGKIQALDKIAKTITINGIEYLLTEKAAQINLRVGAMVEVTVEGIKVTKLRLLT